MLVFSVGQAANPFFAGAFFVQYLLYFSPPVFVFELHLVFPGLSVMFGFHPTNIFRAHFPGTSPLWSSRSNKKPQTTVASFPKSSFPLSGLVKLADFFLAFRFCPTALGFVSSLLGIRNVQSPRYFNHSPLTQRLSWFFFPHSRFIHAFFFCFSPHLIAVPKPVASSR